MPMPPKKSPVPGPSPAGIVRAGRARPRQLGARRRAPEAPIRGRIVPRLSPLHPRAGAAALTAARADRRSNTDAWRLMAIIAGATLFSLALNAF